jgi:NAD(P)-dependent dehydrogenase (short-subunit alcohol dehydrogenase family)
MMDKTILITGSTDGIGQQCAMQLAQMGARVILHGRNPSRGKALLEHIRKKSKNDSVDLFLADFASLRQVRCMADEILAKYPKIDILVNNAGVYVRERQLSEDGFEMTFAVNHLAHFLLTNLLLDALKAGAPSKIVVVSSMAHQNARLDFDNLQGEKRYDAYGTYSISKLANLLFTYELAERLKDTSISVNALHPGVIATKLLQAGFGSFGGSPVEKGAERILHLIISATIDGISGKYFVNDTPQQSSAESRKRDLQVEFWKLSEKLVGL